ncbi:hypothetical protein CR983_02895 [Candidatus Saccharibacteria bacterium]|nr:MAG: hypothetical protein CR983_02895 [Candidatus Saccharibacteria bacterium]
MALSARRLWRGSAASDGSSEPLTGTIANLTATVESASSVRLEWEYSGDDGVAFRLTRDGVVVYEGDGLSFVDTGLNAGTTYTYEIVGEFGTGDVTNTVSESVTVEDPNPGDIEWYVDIDYTGAKRPARIDERITVLDAPFDRGISSLKVVNPCKIYAYTGQNFSDAVIILTASEKNIGHRYYYDNQIWNDAIRSYEVRPTGWKWPKVNNQVSYNLSNGESVPVLAGSEHFSNCNVHDVAVDVRDQSTYNTFKGIISDNRRSVIFEQLSRDVCSVLFHNPDDVPYRIHDIHLQFENTPGTITVVRGEYPRLILRPGAMSAVASYLTAGLVRLYQHYLYAYQATNITNGVSSGFIDYVRIEMGIYDSSDRPDGGGSPWYAGNKTTAFFFDYIQNHAPTPSPNFIKDLHATFDVRNPDIGGKAWDKRAIQACNERGIDVDNLWREYKLWAYKQDGYDVVFYNGKEYYGDSFGIRHGDASNLIAAPFREAVRSVRVINPSKVYMFSQKNQAGAVMFTKKSIPDMYVPHFWRDEAWTAWAYRVMSFRVRPLSWSWPKINNQSNIRMNDGSVTKVKGGSNLYDVVTLRANPPVDVDDTTVHNQVKAIMADHMLKKHFDQASRNACAILHDHADEVDARHYTVKAWYNSNGNIGALYASKLHSYVAFTPNAMTYRGRLASVIAHEFVHLYQAAPSNYSSNVSVTAVVEGIADYATIVMNMPVNPRPAGGGERWNDGYATTAYFFYYITHQAPVKSPNFVKDLNRQLDPRYNNGRTWSAVYITEINARHMSVEALWREYKAWL